ncbi:Tat binding protein 1-interacting protein [Chloropicon primus]|uniref:Tat binding protein 1-interacting protein n=1 Tax=Chloropicon primus TaxID=1764295 RepID=A0A5B8MN86_9CHLO|nr:Tat binding protein 1-interacting protein [Chloropicon primus]UPR01159.1 Tat binding protein 1-interacting protein [Chloropicon primus]|mmetsp:Transcript_11753/g.32524  ORF Transcript_11753/g.32524 Transcript_11753/m.32524 type:complete len:233 (-) Transcript_11753:174-872(-)|eukprot:QDZ21939.1 Tat binding protein 1-interacting protein [Chloropicon primus]
MTSASIKAVHDLLRERNAPFNVQLLVDNLQTKKVKKSQVEKALDALVSQKKVTRKEFGKTKIYFLTQENLEKASSEELAALNKKAADLKASVEAERQGLASMKKELAKLKTESTAEEIEGEIKSSEKSIAEMRAKLDKLNSKSGSVSKESFTEAQLQLQQNLVLWRKYKKIFNEIWYAMADSMGDGFDKKKEKKLLGDIGVETDEVAGAEYSALDDVIKGVNAAKKRRISPA